MVLYIHWRKEFIDSVHLMISVITYVTKNIVRVCAWGCVRRSVVQGGEDA